MRDPRPLWSDHLGRTPVAWCDPNHMVWETLESHDGLTMVALQSDHRAKSGKWSGQWSHDGLIRGQSLENGLDNGRTTVWSEGKVWEVVWTMVALRSDQRAKSHYSLIIGCTKVCTMVALQSDQRPKSGHKLPQNLTIFIYLFDFSFITTVFDGWKLKFHALHNAFLFIFLIISSVQTLTR